MPDPCYLNGALSEINSVDDPTWFADYFPDSRVIKLRYNAPGLWEVGPIFPLPGMGFLEIVLLP